MEIRKGIHLFIQSILETIGARVLYMYCARVRLWPHFPKSDPVGRPMMLQTHDRNRLVTLVLSFVLCYTFQFRHIRLDWSQRKLCYRKSNQCLLASKALASLKTIRNCLACTVRSLRCQQTRVRVLK